MFIVTAGRRDSVMSKYSRRETSDMSTESKTVCDDGVAVWKLGSYINSGVRDDVVPPDSLALHVETLKTSSISAPYRPLSLSAPRSMWTGI